MEMLNGLSPRAMRDWAFRNHDQLKWAPPAMWCPDACCSVRTAPRLTHGPRARAAVRRELGRRFAQRAAIARDEQFLERRQQEAESAKRKKLLEQNVRTCERALFSAIVA